MKGLFVGLTTLDIQFLMPKYPAPNTKNFSQQTLLSAGGPATNASVCFSHMGGSSVLLTHIGKNVFNKFLLEEIESLGVDIFDIAENREVSPVISGIVTSLDNGERTVITNRPGQHDFFESDIFTDVYDICLFDGYYLNLAEFIIRKAHESHKPVVLDGGSWKAGMEKVLKYIDFAICSSNFFPPGCNTVDQSFNFLEEFGISNAAITRGGDSILVMENNRKYQIPVNQVEVKDTLGAGDIFHGAFCYYILNGHNFAKSLVKASKYASESCKYEGTRKWLKYI